MPEPRRVLSSLSFIVRFWLERTPSHSPSHNLRGRITRVSARGPDEQQAVTELEDVTRFIEDALEQEGVIVKPTAEPAVNPVAKPAHGWRWLRWARGRERR